MAIFFFGNGFKNKERAEMIIKFYNKKYHSSYGNDARKWRQRFYQFRSIFDWLKKAEDPYDGGYYQIRNAYYYYNMIADQTMYLDGYIRGKNGEKKEYFDYFSK